MSDNWMETSDPSVRPMRCDCGSEQIETALNVGWDVDPSGEERQHEDKCQACGATRLWAERYDNFTKPVIWWGKWDKPTPLGSSVPISTAGD